MKVYQRMFMRCLSPHKQALLVRYWDGKPLVADTHAWKLSTCRLPQSSEWFPFQRRPVSIIFQSVKEKNLHQMGVINSHNFFLSLHSCSSIVKSIVLFICFVGCSTEESKSNRQKKNDFRWAWCSFRMLYIFPSLSQMNRH